MRTATTRNLGSAMRKMAMAEATTIGAVNAIAAAGTLANTNVPPPSTPAQRQAIITCSPGDALEKNKRGNMAHKLPKNMALRAVRIIVLRETYEGLASAE